MRTSLALLALTMGLGSAPAIAQEPVQPLMTHIVPEDIAKDPANQLTLNLSNGGTVVIQLRPDAAPQHVYRVQQLASAGFYDGLIFHRVVPGFMAQTGDPQGTGMGGSDLPDLPAEFNRLPHLRGAFAMAREGAPQGATPEQERAAENSANSQFYIMFTPRFALDREYTVLGRVISGMQAVDNIAPGEPPAQPTRIVSATIGGPLPAPPTPAPVSQEDVDEVRAPTPE
ncbi:MAG: peptidylprolyl isomerase [Sphingomonas sp.]|nr:peptidylprolyl isomerase [Sphingomonas sp.]RZV52721.1 MAG: peptidylprolyl isomerase [Sphingomonadaceae bacterium]